MFAAAVSLSIWASAQAPPVAVTVVDADGKPAAGARVWCYPYSDDKATVREPKPATADAAGRATAQGMVGRYGARYAFAQDAAGRVGSAQLSRRSEAAEGARIVVLPLVARTGRVTTADGKPVAGARVGPAEFYADDESRRGGSLPYSLSLPPWTPPQTTGPDGSFRAGAPAGYNSVLSVTAGGFGEQSFFAPAGADPAPVLREAGRLALSVSGVDAARLKGAGWQLRAADPQAVPGTRPVGYKAGTFDGTPGQVIGGLYPGRYELSVSDAAAVPALFQKAGPVEVTSGGTATITASFGPAATVTGRVLGPDGRGVGGARVRVVGYAGASNPQPTQWLSATTAADGSFAAHGPAGWYAASLPEPPAGYAAPFVRRDRGQLTKPARVELGQSHAAEPIRLLAAKAVTGRVVFEGGNPAAGARVEVPSMTGRDRSVTAGAGGAFSVPDLPPDDAISPRVRFEGAVNVPETIEVERATGPVTIEISSRHAAGFAGRVLDAEGKSIAGAKVSLRHHYRCVGRDESFGVQKPVASAETDAAGRYEFRAFWPKDRYSVAAGAAGFGGAEGREAVGEAGKLTDLGAVTLTRAGLAVKGTVRDAAGKPVAGAAVFSVDGPERGETKSGPDGSFALSKFADAPAWVFARKAGYKLALAEVTPGDGKPAALTLAQLGAPPAPAPVVSAEHNAAMDRLTRHLLARLWEGRGGHDWGPKALVCMAQYDFETARKWRDEEKARPGGKDYSESVEPAARRKALAAAATEDIEEAMALLAAKKGGVYEEALELARGLLPSDPAKAARVAEEVAVRARGRGLPEKVLALANAGELAAQAGNAAGGRKLLAEAADLAEKLDFAGQTRATMYAGMVAARLAPYDWPRAEAMLDRFTVAGEYNRWLAGACVRVAPADFPKAKELLGRFKPDSSNAPDNAKIKVALAAARTRPDDAEALVAGLADPGTRMRGHAELAGRFGRADAARAVRQVDLAFAVIEGGGDGLSRWSSFGGRSTFAAAAAVRGARAGHPDVADLVARALAVRPTTRDAYSDSGRADTQVKTAAALALIDPESARRVLAGAAPPGRYAEAAAGKDRDWLFALALADPGRAIALVDTLLDRAKARPDEGGGDAISATGVVELAAILVGADQLKELGQWGTLWRELADDE